MNRIANTKLREPIGHETNPPSSTNETSKQSDIQDSVDCTRTIEEVLNPNIQVSNRFSNLNIDESIQNDVNATQNDPIIDHREPATIPKEVNGKNNRRHYINSKETRQTCHHPRSNIAIVGDPMLKHKNPTQLRKSTRSFNTQIRTFPCRCEGTRYGILC